MPGTSVSRVEQARRGFVAQLQLSERELHLLRASLASAVEGACMPQWELEALTGCSQGALKRCLDAGTRRLERRGELPSESTRERMVLLLSATLGASHGQAASELEGLIARLATPERSPLESGIALRGDVLLGARANQR
jgi:hypothetical protein